MKKLTRSPITWIILLVLALAMVLYFCGFRITYAPDLENSWNAISACASWASVIVAGFAIYYAILVPQKIAQEQNKIALFEKRYEVFQLFERCFSFAKAIEKSETTESMRKDCMILFDELKYEELDFKVVMKKVYSCEHTLHQMEFLFPNVLENDVHELYSSLWKVLMAIIGDENANECKKTYINTMNDFVCKYYKMIWNELALTNK
jgi:hypothetical protein